MELAAQGLEGLRALYIIIITIIMIITIIIMIINIIIKALALGVEHGRSFQARASHVTHLGMIALHPCLGAQGRVTRNLPKWHKVKGPLAEKERSSGQQLSFGISG